MHGMLHSYFLLLWVLLGMLSSGGYRIRLSRPCALRKTILNAHPADFSTGMTLEIDGSPLSVLEYSHIKMARAAALIRVKLRNMLTGGVVEHTFRPGDSVQECYIAKIKMEFSHSEGEELVFVDLDTDEETRIPQHLVKNQELLSEGLECTILKWNDKIIEVQLPNKLEFEVSDVRVSGSAKTAILDCGLDVVVPSFIKIGD